MDVNSQQFQQRIARIESLVKNLESAADPVLRQTARELLESLMELHGAGYQRILEIVSDTPVAGLELVESLARDELIGSLLVLYNLHPEDFEARVRRGLDKVRPLLRSQGVRIDHIGIEGAAVRLKLVGAGPEGIHTAIRAALLEVAPDAAEIFIEGGQPTAAGFVPLSSLVNSNPAAVANAGANRP